MGFVRVRERDDERWLDTPGRKLGRTGVSEVYGMMSAMDETQRDGVLLLTQNITGTMPKHLLLWS